MTEVQHFHNALIFEDLAKNKDGAVRNGQAGLTFVALKRDGANLFQSNHDLALKRHDPHNLSRQATLSAITLLQHALPHPQTFLIDAKTIQNRANSQMTNAGIVF